MDQELVHEDYLQWVVPPISIEAVVVNKSSSKEMRMKYASEVFVQLTGIWDVVISRIRCMALAGCFQ